MSAFKSWQLLRLTTPLPAEGCRPALPAGELFRHVRTERRPGTGGESAFLVHAAHAEGCTACGNGCCWDAVVDPAALEVLP